MATPDILFGEEVSKGLASLLYTLSKAAEMAVGRPEVINELFSSLGRIEGAAKNLRGALFEMLVGHCVKKNDDGSIDIGKKVSDLHTGKSADIDVFRVKEYREVWSYECKGHQPSEMVRLSAVEHWLTNRVPLIHNIISREKRFQDCEFHYEYWTSGQFEPEAVDFLQGSAKRTKKYLIGWKDGSAVRKYAAKIKPKTISLMFDEHFFDHPLK